MTWTHSTKQINHTTALWWWSRRTDEIQWWRVCWKRTSVWILTDNNSFSTFISRKLFLNSWHIIDRPGPFQQLDGHLTVRNHEFHLNTKASPGLKLLWVESSRFQSVQRKKMKNDISSDNCFSKGQQHFQSPTVSEVFEHFSDRRTWKWFLRYHGDPTGEYAVANTSDSWPSECLCLLFISNVKGILVLNSPDFMRCMNTLLGLTDVFCCWCIGVATPNTITFSFLKKPFKGSENHNNTVITLWNAFWCCTAQRSCPVCVEVRLYPSRSSTICRNR